MQTSLLVLSLWLVVPPVLAIGEGVADSDILSGILQGFAEIFDDVNTTTTEARYLMGKWHQMYKAAINFDVFRTNMYCPVSYFKSNLVMGPEGFSVEEAYHVISKTGPIETYRKDASKTGPGQYWMYPHEYFYPHQFFILKTGPVVNGSYQYIIATDQNKLALTVLARDPFKFYQDYDKEVLDYLKEERFGNPVFWNQPVAIYHGTDCYYPSEREVFARRVLSDMVRQKQGGGQPDTFLSNPLQAVQGFVGGLNGGKK